MADMSRAVRETCEQHGFTALQTAPDDVLGEFTTILGSFYLDFKSEIERRAGLADQNERSRQQA
jgi:hypothetical protein